MKYWESSSNLDGAGIIDLPLYAIIFSLHGKIGSTEESKDPEDPEETFYILVPSLFSQWKEDNLLLPVLRNVCFLIDLFVYQSFYKVLFGGHPLSTCVRK